MLDCRRQSTMRSTPCKYSRAMSANTSSRSVAEFDHRPTPRLPGQTVSNPRSSSAGRVFQIRTPSEVRSTCFVKCTLPFLYAPPGFNLAAQFFLPAIKCAFPAFFLFPIRGRPVAEAAEDGREIDWLASIDRHDFSAGDVLDDGDRINRYGNMIAIHAEK